MNGTLQNRINPVVPRNTADFSDAKIKEDSKAEDSGVASKTSFKDLLLNSNDEISKQRSAQKNGDGLKAAKSDAEFAKMLTDRLNRDNVRNPQNSLDKDAFLKLFVSQMQNQDPLNPDDSAEMAAQLAQFNGLEQMMNVNKNLEKMQAEQALSRAVGLTSFVGKEVKIASGRAMYQGGQLSHIQAHFERDVPKATMEVRNSAGVVIANRDLGALKAGDNKLEWDGIDSKGQKVSEGLYTFSVSAKDLNGLDIPGELSSIVSVKGVDLRESGGSFYTEIGPVKVSEIASVGDGGFSRIGSTSPSSAGDKSGAVTNIEAEATPEALPVNTNAVLKTPKQSETIPTAMPARPKISPTGEILPS